MRELRQIIPRNFQEYRKSTRDRRACERLLHISIESVLDMCNMLASRLRLGLPGDEEDLLQKLQEAETLSTKTIRKIRSLKAFRNILVHRYGRLDDKAVYEILKKHLEDFEEFIAEVRKILREK